MSGVDIDIERRKLRYRWEVRLPAEGGANGSAWTINGALKGLQLGLAIVRDGLELDERIRQLQKQTTDG